MTTQYRTHKLRPGDDHECRFCDEKAIFRIGTSDVVCCDDHVDRGAADLNAEQTKKSAADYRLASRGY